MNFGVAAAAGLAASVLLALLQIPPVATWAGRRLVGLAQAGMLQMRATGSMS